MKKSGNFSKIYLFILLVIMTVALYGCGKKDPKELYKGASIATEKKLKDEAEKMTSQNPVLKKMDQLSKEGMALSAHIESSENALFNTISIKLKDDPKSKVMAMMVNALGSSGELYLDDNNVTLQILGQTLRMPTQGIAENLKKWLIDNGLIQYVPGLEAGDFSDLNAGYSDLVAMSNIQENMIDQYVATFRSLEDIAQYSLGEEENIQLSNNLETSETVKAQTVLMTFGNEDYKAWIDKLITQLKEDNNAKQWSEMMNYLLALSQSSEKVDINTLIAQLEKAKEYDAANVSVKAYIVKGIIQKYIMILDDPAVEKDKIEMSLSFLGNKNLMGKVEMYMNTESGKKISMLGEGNWIPKENVVSYSYTMSGWNGEESPSKINFTWDIGKTDAENIQMTYNDVQKTGFIGFDQNKNIHIYFSPIPGIEKIDITIEPFKETITVPADGKNIFEMTKGDLLKLLFGR